MTIANRWLDGNNDEKIAADIHLDVEEVTATRKAFVARLAQPLIPRQPS